jgi:hypothetical protein
VQAVRRLIDQLIAPYPSATYSMSVRMPADWQVKPRSDRPGFVLQSPNGRSGMAFGIGKGSGADPHSDLDRFPWPQDTQLGQRLSQRGITAREITLGELTAFTETHPAYFWHGQYNPAWSQGYVAPRAVASNGHYRLRVALQEEEYTGFITVIPYGQTFLEIIGFAPTEEWEDMVPYFSAILASMEEPPADWTPQFPAAEGGALSPTAGWSSSMSISSGGPGYSVRYPPDWIRPDRLQDGEGFQLTSADQQIAVVVRIRRGGDPAALLAGWQAPDLTNPTIEDGDPITITGITAPSRIARGQDASGADVTAGAAYGQSGAYVLEVVWSAPSGETWDGAQETFAGVLASIRVWTTQPDAAQYGLNGMMVSYPTDWNLAAAPEGEGLWASTADGAMGLVVWVREGGDPAALLAAWDGATLAGSGDFAQVTVEDSSPVYVLEGQQASKSWQAQDGLGTAVQGSVAFARYEGAVLEIVWYAPSDQWDSVSENVFSNLHMMLMAP